jgi:hypothetical protein
MLNNDVNSKTLSRIELLKLAHTLQVTDADVMTRAELRAAIERARAPEARPQTQSASWLGKARRLLASVVERGLHLPEAATLIRGGLPVRPFSGGPPPVATVTLARIYAAQGHLVRAIGILDEVLVSDPDHDLARGLRQELQQALDQRREQERKQAADSAPDLTKAAGKAAPDEAAPDEAAPDEEVPASEGQLAAYELLGAVPDGEATGVDEITLAGTIAEARPAEAKPAESQPIEVAPLEAQAQPPATRPELEVETRRGSDVPASAPEPETIAASAPEPETIAASASEPQVVAEPPVAQAQPRPTGLVLIETSEPSAYLYWELAVPALANGLSNGNGASNGNGVESHWLCVVAHAPRGAGSERREYRFPVQRAAGAVRIEGLPRYAVVRAKLTRGPAPEAAPLVVAGSVRVECTADGCSGSALTQAQPGFLPHPAADPASLAARAADHLASAAPLYY